MLLQEWSKLSDEEKKKWPSSEVLWAFNPCGPGMLDYNMWTDFIAPELGELCIGSPTIELLQLSSQWSGLGRVNCPFEFNTVWGFGGPCYGSNYGFGTIKETPIVTSQEPFITPYGFNGSNSGVIFSGLEDKMIYFGTWVFRWYEMAGIRPCVKIQSKISYNPDSLMLE